MPSKRKAEEEDSGLWIAESYSLKGPTGDRAWENRRGGIPSNNKYLELADIALGVKKSDPKVAKGSFKGTHVTVKKEPYSG
jgi:hypothetical protein